MPRPLALCLEDLDCVVESERYLQCTALVGRAPGLVIAKDRIAWSAEGRVGCELWVSADERLILYRTEGAEPATVTRAGRSLEVPIGKPVVLRDGDQLRTGSQHLRVHVHGFTSRVTPPSPFALRRMGGAARVAAAVALSAALTGSGEGCASTVEVREEPPSVVVVEPLPLHQPDPRQNQNDWNATPNQIEVRETPPVMVTPEQLQPEQPLPVTPEVIEVREAPPDMPAE